MRRFDKREPEGEHVLRLREALLAGDGPTAHDVLGSALSTGMERGTVFDEVVRPAMTAIGERWEQGQITVADEHMATELVTAALSGLRPAERRTRKQTSVMLAGVEGERHIVGLRMAANLLEDAGYRALYLGADVPVISLGPLVRRRAPDVVAFTATMPGSEDPLRRAVAAVRGETDARIIAGGPGAARAFAAGESVTVLSDVRSVVAAVAALTGAESAAPDPV